MSCFQLSGRMCFKQRDLTNNRSIWTEPDGLLFSSAVSVFVLLFVCFLFSPEMVLGLWGLSEVYVLLVILDQGLLVETCFSIGL